METHFQPQYRLLRTFSQLKFVPKYLLALYNSLTLASALTTVVDGWKESINSGSDTDLNDSCWTMDIKITFCGIYFTVKI